MSHGDGQSDLDCLLSVKEIMLQAIRFGDESHCWPRVSFTFGIIFDLFSNDWCVAAWCQVNT